MLKYTGALARFPARAMFGTYLLAIIVGGLLLYTPWARQHEPSAANPHITLVDSFFTATSAVCVTGLSVRPIGDYFSFFGQAVLLLLVQIGGVGIMTMATFLTKLLGAADTLRERQTLSETLGATAKEGVRRIGLQVLGATLVIEAVGFLLLLPSFLRVRPPMEACWWALFHAVSAFCNAGFGLHQDNLVPWRADPLLNFTIMGLIVFGGIGFPVLTDLRRSAVRQVTERGRPGTRLWGRLLLSTKLTVVGTVCLIVGGAVLIGMLEWNRTLKGLAWPEKVVASLFASVTPRTAGFNTLDYGKMATATLFVTMLLMLIGGGPASTAGGTKVTTLMVLLAQAWAKLTGMAHTIAFRRTIDQKTIDRASLIVLLFALLTMLGTLGVVVVAEEATIDHGSFLKQSFEVISALCTVGLSVGGPIPGTSLAAGLADLSKFFLILLMFAGRIGPLSLYAAVARQERGMKARPVHEEVLVG